jgi:hypothetical protein
MQKIPENAVIRDARRAQLEGNTERSLFLGICLI